MTPDDFLGKYKEGDVLVIREHWIVIFAGLREPQSVIAYDTKAIVYHALMDARHNDYITLKKRTGIGYTKDYKDNEVRFATNSEIHSFFNRLKELHARWDAEAKQLVVNEPILKQYM